MIGFIGTTTIETDRVQVFGEFLITKTLPVRSMHIGPDELKRAKTDSSLQPKPAHPTAIISGKGGVMADNNCTCPDCGLNNLAKLMEKAQYESASAREARWEKEVYGPGESYDSDGCV